MDQPNDDRLARNSAARQAALANLAVRRAEEEAAAQAALATLAARHAEEEAVAQAAIANLNPNPHIGTSRRQGGGRYTMRRTRRGCQVVRGRKTFSRRPIACSRAERQIQLLRAIERGWKPSRRQTRRVRK